MNIPTDQNATEIARIRNELRTTGKVGAEDENILQVARDNAQKAKRLRELRGHGDLFKIENTTNDPRN